MSDPLDASEIHEVSGCSSCPMAYLDDGCIPRCLLVDVVGGGPVDPAEDHSPNAKHCQSRFRDDVPPECPLRAGEFRVRLAVAL